MSILYIYFVFLFVFPSVHVIAQQKKQQYINTIKQVVPQNENYNRKKNILWSRKSLDPGRAFTYSMIFPGAGQVYNKKYWKVPIVLGGLVGGALLINQNQTQYYTLKKELYKLLNDSKYVPPSGLSEGQLRGNINNALRNRDLFTALTVLWYFLQAVEAHVDAHLSFLTKNPNFEVNIKPVLGDSRINGNSIGVNLQIRF